MRYLRIHPKRAVGIETADAIIPPPRLGCKAREGYFEEMLNVSVVLKYITYIL